MSKKGITFGSELTTIVDNAPKIIEATSEAIPKIRHSAERMKNETFTTRTTVIADTAIKGVSAATNIFEVVTNWQNQKHELSLKEIELVDKMAVAAQNHKVEMMKIAQKTMEIQETFKFAYQELADKTALTREKQENDFTLNMKKIENETLQLMQEFKKDEEILQTLTITTQEALRAFLSDSKNESLMRVCLDCNDKLIKAYAINKASKLELSKFLDDLSVIEAEYREK